MRCKVFIAPQAEADLRDIHEFILKREGPLRATAVFQKLKATILGLAQSPLRGKEPPELEPLGETDYLQIVATPWRIIYFVRKTEVHIVVVADGRRDFSTLLAHRLREQSGDFYSG